VVVTVNGITQNHPANYSTNDTVLTFTDPPAVSSVIRVLQQAMIGTSIVPIDGSVGTSKLASGLTLSGSTTLSGNLAFSGTGTRILGDFSNATFANRVVFQSSITNGATQLSVIPNGTGTTSTLQLYNNSDIANSSRTNLAVISTESRLSADITGTGTYLPLTMYTGGSERLRIDTSGNVGIGTNSPNEKLGVAGAIASTSNASNFNQAKFLLDYNSGSGRLSSYASGGSTIEFYTNASGGNVAERMRITAAGAVLIAQNSSNPGATLSVTGNIQPAWQDGRMGVVFDNSYRQGMQFDAAARQLSIFNTTNDSGGDILFKTRVGLGSSDTDYGTERMRITAAGNVGIGLTNPGRKLVVKTGDGDGIGIQNGAGTEYRLAVNLDNSFSVVNSGVAERLRVNTSGALVLQGGSSSSNGVGIAFPATQSASSDANTLDDYEEGTFTPTLFGTVTAGTLSVGTNYGEYTKIGNVVNFWIRIENQTLTGAAGPMAIGNLPFSRAGLSSMDPPYTPGLHNIAFSTTGRSWFYLRGTTLAGLQAVSSSAWVDWNVTNSSGIYITVSGSYRV
jgi:hypothetical protein